MPATRFSAGEGIAPMFCQLVALAQGAAPDRQFGTTADLASDLVK
jgi:hypothetical protein